MTVLLAIRGRVTSLMSQCALSNLHRLPRLGSKDLLPVVGILHSMQLRMPSEVQLDVLTSFAPSS